MSDMTLGEFIKELKHKSIIIALYEDMNEYASFIGTLGEYENWVNRPNYDKYNIVMIFPKSDDKKCLYFEIFRGNKNE